MKEQSFIKQKSETIILILCSFNVISNTQKIGYIYAFNSFKFLNESGQDNNVQVFFAWLLSLFVILTVELSILVFISKGIKWLSVLFALMVFILNFRYFSLDVKVWDFYNYALLQDVAVWIMLSSMSPIIVYAYSELYIKEINSKEELIKNELASSILETSKVNELETKLLIEKQVSSKLNQMIKTEKQIVSDFEQKISSSIALIESLKKDKENIISEKSNLSKTIDVLKNEKQKLKLDLDKWIDTHTCKGCGYVFNNAYKLSGHLKTSNCKS